MKAPYKTKADVKSNKIVQALAEIHGVKWYAMEGEYLLCQRSNNITSHDQFKFSWHDDIETGDALDMAERGITRI